VKYVCNSFHVSRLTFYVEKLNREQDAQECDPSLRSG